MQKFNIKMHVIATLFFIVIENGTKARRWRAKQFKQNGLFFLQYKNIIIKMKKYLIRFNLRNLIL